MEEIKDERFSHISSDPRFRATPKSIRKVKIDKRFQSLFTDKRFQVKYSVDKRGRPVNQSSQENYRKYYDVMSDDESTDEEDDSDEDKSNEETVETQINDITSENEKKIRTTKLYKSNKWSVSPAQGSSNSNESSNNLDAENRNEVEKKPHNKNKDKSKNQEAELETDKLEKARMTDEIKLKLRDPHIDYARGVGALMSDSSSEEESSESESESEVEHGWGELDRDAELTEDATSRLAVLHMDWDRIRAVDLMVLLNSFLPQNGVIKSVTIYPSQFGLERMKEEEERGPIELVNLKHEDDADLDEESKEGKKYHTERLRQYQMNRLKYYYAVVEFDSVETANKVYTECDGLEYESSATKLDLRYVPQDETFDQEPHEVCTSMPDPAKYEPRIFTNTALQQGKVELTWDETDPSRQEFTRKIQRNADKVDDVDLQAYLASSSGEDEELADKDESSEDESEDDKNIKEEDKIAKYKSLLASIEEEEEKKKNRDVDLEITWGIGLKEKAEKSVKEKLNAPQTPFEEMLDKRKKKKKQKREEKLKQKEKNKEEDSESDLYSDDDLPSDVDMNDPYFKEEIQPAKRGGKKKKKNYDEEETEETKQKKAELELLLLEENDTEKEKSHFNLKKIQEQESDGKKKKRRKQLKKKPQEVLEEKDEFKVNVADDRFSALFSSHHFNVDPADPQFRKTKAMEAIISEKLKRRRQQVEQEEPAGKKTKAETELSLLVNRIKSKTKNKIKN
ncbi:ESF1 homolog [Macrosteles quadrilineatus]|uniref:ESF1 homolog n=1 Tax=Macrosteles quadrilineatus TaxID=74068 RepID=UPI0023E2965B|nr:ESF1 homolog [Macrosteles quadrilineatus]XP_054264674.1 ESF1 homolog [Macrosteles quadrilineatus]